MSKKNSTTKNHSNHNYLNTQKSNAQTKVNGNLVQLWLGSVGQVIPSLMKVPQTLAKAVETSLRKNSKLKVATISKLTLMGLLAATIPQNAFASPIDIDNDGVLNSADLDSDNDGILNTAEGSCTAGVKWAITSPEKPIANSSGDTLATLTSAGVVVNTTASTNGGFFRELLAERINYSEDPIGNGAYTITLNQEG